MPASSHAATELMELAEAEAFCIFNYHKGCIGYVHTYFYNGCSDQNIYFSGCKVSHYVFFFLCLQPAVDTCGPELGKCIRKLLRMLLGGFEMHSQVVIFLNHGTYHIYLSALAYKLSYEIVEPFPVALIYGKGVHLLSPGRQLVQNRDVQIPVHYKSKCAGDRRCRHDQNMGASAFAYQGRALTYAEAVLLIGNDKTKP